MPDTGKNMKDAVKLALAGGWVCTVCVEPEKNYHWYKSSILLDPLFWRALGKSLGWEEIEHTHMVTKKNVVTKMWLSYWHRFIDHLAEGKDAESFFEELLTKSK